jgi:ferredoxin
MIRRGESLRLRVDPIMCDGYGHCAELAPELVKLDEWGYPILHDEAFSSSSNELVRSAQLAIRGCPRQAMWLEHITAQR